MNRVALSLSLATKPLWWEVCVVGFLAEPARVAADTCFVDQ